MTSPAPRAAAQQPAGNRFGADFFAAEAMCAKSTFDSYGIGTCSRFVAWRILLSGTGVCPGSSLGQAFAGICANAPWPATPAASRLPAPHQLRGQAREI